MKGYLLLIQVGKFILCISPILNIRMQRAAIAQRLGPTPVLSRWAPTEEWTRHTCFWWCRKPTQTQKDPESKPAPCYWGDSGPLAAFYFLNRDQLFSFFYLNGWKGLLIINYILCIFTIIIKYTLFLKNNFYIFYPCFRFILELLYQNFKLPYILVFKKTKTKLNSLFIPCQTNNE